MATALSRSGMQPTPPNPSKVATGARISLELNSKPVGYATIASYSETIGYDAVAVLDQLQIAEHVPVSYDVTFTASRLYVITHSLKQRDFMPKWDEGTDSSALLLSILTQGAMTASIIDQQESTIIRLEGVRVASHNITFGARAIVGEDVAFVAIRAIDSDAE